MDDRLVTWWTGPPARGLGGGGGGGGGGEHDRDRAFARVEGEGDLEAGVEPVSP